MKTKQYIFTLVLILISSLIQSQTTPKFQWVKGGGSTGNSWNNDHRESADWLGTDAHGNIYSMSSLMGFNIQIDTSSKPTGWGYDDLAVFSYNCEGNMRWVKYFGSWSQDRPGGFAVDLQGNSYVSGFVAVNYDWNVNGHYGDTTVIAQPDMSWGNFITKLDSNGHTLWLKMLGNPVNDLFLTIVNVELDNTGNPCILIQFHTTGNWGGYTISEKGLYFVKVNKDNGNIISLIKPDLDICNIGASRFTVLFSFDESNSYFVNLQVDDTVKLGSNITILNTYPIDGYRKYLLIKLSANGNLIWYKELGGKFSNYTHRQMYGKPIIKNNKVYINGAAHNHISVFGDTINNPFLPTSFDLVPMNLCFDKNNGNYISLKHFYNSEYCDRFFYTYISDKIYMSGSAVGYVMLNATDTLKPYYHNYKSNPFVIALDTNHTQFEWGIGTKVNSDDTRITSITTDLAGNIYAGGKVTDSLYDSFGRGYRTMGGEGDFFISKISTHNNCGCIKSQPYPQLLGINNKTIIVKGMASGLPDSLYWSWGDGTTTPYSAQNTNITHTYAVGGNYNVCLHTSNYCGIMESCLNINGVGINEQELKYMNVYPNPVNDILTIENPYQCSMQLNIYTIAGKLLYSNKYENYTTSIDMSNYEKGIYIVEMILADGRKAVKKLVRS